MSCKKNTVISCRAQLLCFFNSHLDNIYCLNSHLMERLPEIAIQERFIDLKPDLLKIFHDTGKRQIQLDELYMLTDTTPPDFLHSELAQALENSYDDIHRYSGIVWFRDLAVLFYMQRADYLGIASLNLLKIIVSRMKKSVMQQLVWETIEQIVFNNEVLLRSIKKRLKKAESD